MLIVERISKSVYVGYTTFDVAEVQHLSELCWNAIQVSASQEPLFMCSLGFGVCRFRGKCVRFRYYPKSGVFRVIWCCNKLECVQI